MAAGVSRLGYFGYGLLAYLVFGGSLLWTLAFLAGIGPLPTVDRVTSVPPPLAVAIDLALFGLFAVQHTVMARPAFKRATARFLPDGSQRSTFVLAASLVLLLLLWQWRPLPGSVWNVSDPYQSGALWVVYALGWAFLVASTFMIDHLELFGLRQSWLAARGRRAVAPSFRSAWLYAWIRHPIMTGFLILLWATPRMSIGHLTFSVAASAYILVGIWFEERDLLRAIPEYAEYRGRVGGLLPRPWPMPPGSPSGEKQRAGT
ncbi:MAG: isoprenylcysteine carboxylmethyltransferase family protein [Candidatus Dormibacteraceae bacterium]